jgi:hypothetical protein
MASDADAECFRALTLLVAVLEQASVCVGECHPRDDALIERIVALRNVVSAELQTGRFAPVVAATEDPRRATSARPSA